MAARVKKLDSPPAGRGLAVPSFVSRETPPVHFALAAVDGTYAKALE